MAKFMKKPLVVDAVIWHGKYTDGTEWPDWFREAWGKKLFFYLGGKRLAIESLNEQSVADLGDVVFFHPDGYIGTLRPEIFEREYVSMNSPEDRVNEWPQWKKERFLTK